ncbi:pentapeptide repeat-containing protein [Streptomyces europaeiscabiei]|uniref:pentapeptide repeat-containing protein n=1 Tax=Streptomyces europaeiscabiei TaxID=146819 RepID=UPI002E18DBEB
MGCRGIRISGQEKCLAHLTSVERAAHLAALGPGADIDARGVPFTEPLLAELLAAHYDRNDNLCRFGDGLFDEAVFTEDAKFRRTTYDGNVAFSGSAQFHRARFNGEADFCGVNFARAAEFNGAVFKKGARFTEASTDALWFREATFNADIDFHRASASYVDFSGATFHRLASFSEATFDGGAFYDATFHWHTAFSGTTFKGSAQFDGTVFKKEAAFGGATFRDDARFNKVTFMGNAEFSGTTFNWHVWFAAAQFESAQVLGPLLAEGMVTFGSFDYEDLVGGPIFGDWHLEGAVFAAPVTVEVSAPAVSFAGTRFEGPATLRVRYAVVDLSEMQLTHPVTVASTQTPLRDGDTVPTAAEALLVFGRDTASAQVVSLSRVDAALLVLSDIDLSRCQFAGTHHLDQLGLEGECTFATPPKGIRWSARGPLWWSSRQVLAEEHHWRALEIHPPALREGWQIADPDLHPGPSPGPAGLAVAYRKLRKAFEEGKDEPGAADFYYGEMEMRRHDRRRTSRAERLLLHAYWLLSGYGLRASRAFAWLGAAMAATVIALVLVGLPNSDPKMRATGVQPPPGRQVDLTIVTSEPLLTGSLANRITWARAEKASRVVVNSVIFRSSGQNLTTSGTYIEMTSRLSEPVLLGLALLAIRGRVKR